MLQIFPVEQWVDTNRQWCGASSGRLIRIPVNNTELTAHGLWLISTHPFAAERSSRKAETIKYNIWTYRKVLCNKKALLRPSYISEMANTVATVSQASLQSSSSVAVNGLPVMLYCGK